jgi:hypothetical protein
MCEASRFASGNRTSKGSHAINAPCTSIPFQPPPIFGIAHPSLSALLEKQRWHVRFKFESLGAWSLRRPSRSKLRLVPRFHQPIDDDY